MHVYFVGSPNILYPEPLGAIERYVYGLSKELSKKIDVSVSGFGTGSEDSGNYSLRTFSSGSFRAFRNFPEQRLRGMSCGAIHNACAFRDIRRVHKRNPIDLIHANTIYSTPFATLCKRVLGIPFVCSIHNELLTAKPFFACDRVLPVSDYLQQILTEKGVPNKMTVLPDAINPQAYNSTTNIEKQKELLGLSNRKVILFVGRKCPEKGPQIIVDALPSIVKQYPNTTAIFIGPDNYFGSNSSSYTQYLLSLAQTSHVDGNVVFKGYVSETQLRQYYNATDVFVCPSIWNEPFGMVILEALSYCKPVIASQVGGIPEIIDDNKTGVLTPPGNAKKLSNAIVNLFSNPAFGRELGANGRKRVQEKFSFEAVAKLCLGVYKNVLDKD